MDNAELPPGFFWRIGKDYVSAETDFLVLAANKTISRWARDISVSAENLAMYRPGLQRMSIWGRAKGTWEHMTWTGTEEDAKQYMLNALYLGMLQIGTEGEPE